MAGPSEKRTLCYQAFCMPKRNLVLLNCSLDKKDFSAKYCRPKKYHTNKAREDSNDNKLQPREDNRLLSDFLVSALVGTKPAIVIPFAAYLYPSECSY